MEGDPQQLFGRADELAAGEALITGAPRRRRVLVFEGEAGIGKTAVWRHVAHTALERGVRVLSCRAAQAETQLSFVALADLLEPISDALLPTLPPPQRTALDVALLRSAPVGVVDPRAVGAGVLSVLSALASTTPVLLAVDDLQWLDSASDAALTFALRRLEDQPITICVTVRDNLDAAGDPLGLHQTFGPAVRRYPIGPLTLDHLHQVINASFGDAIPRSMLRQVHRSSGGNPLFALELTRALERTGPKLRPGEPLPVPDTLGALVEERVTALPPAARQALLAVASVSTPTVEIVERVLGDAVEDDLQALTDSGLLVRRKERLHFTHPLFAAAVYAAAEPDQRRQLHRRLSAVVSDTEEQARHVALASDVPDDRAAELLERAAEQARARGAPGAAGELQEAAMRLTPTDQSRTLLQRTIRAAEYQYRAGDLARARSLLEATDPEDGDDQERALALRLLAEVRYNEAGFPAAGALLEQALSYADDDATCAEILLDLAFVAFNVGDVSRALAAATRAREHAQALTSGPLLAEALAVEANVAFLSGRGMDDDKVRRALALEERDRNVQLLMRPSAIAALFALYGGRLRDASARFEKLRAWAEQRGEDSDCVFLTWLSWTETLLGNVAEGRKAADQALGLARQAGSHPIRGVALMHRGMAEAYLGNATQARADLDESAALLERAGWTVVHAWTQWTLGFLELSAGDPVGAARVLEPYVAALEIDGVGEPFVVSFVPDAVEALIASGGLDRAERLLDDFESRARELRRRSALAGATRCRALLLAARGNMPRALEVAEVSVHEAGRLEVPVERGRSLLVRGQVLRRARRKGAARESFEQALQVLEGVSASLWVERTASELRRVGDRAGPGDLTVTEQRVAELAATGRTNREIAAELFISPKTVEANLARVYRKLEIRSRAELGRLMAAR